MSQGFSRPLPRPGEQLRSPVAVRLALPVLRDVREPVQVHPLKYLLVLEDLQVRRQGRRLRLLLGRGVAQELVQGVHHEEDLQGTFGVAPGNRCSQAADLLAFDAMADGTGAEKAGVVGCLLLTIAEIVGIYHGFAKHHVADGVLTILVPPWAWYRGGESLWHREPPPEPSRNPERDPTQLLPTREHTRDAPPMRTLQEWRRAPEKDKYAWGEWVLRTYEVTSISPGDVVGLAEVVIDKETPGWDLVAVARKVVDLLPRKHALPPLTAEESAALGTVMAKVDELWDEADIELLRSTYRDYQHRVGRSVVTPKELELLGEQLETMQKYERELGKCMLLSLDAKDVVESHDLKILREQASIIGRKSELIEQDKRMLHAVATGEPTRDAKGVLRAPPTREKILKDQREVEVRAQNFARFTEVLRSVASEK